MINSRKNNHKLHLTLIIKNCRALKLMVVMKVYIVNKHAENNGFYKTADNA